MHIRFFTMAILLLNAITAISGDKDSANYSGQVNSLRVKPSTVNGKSAPSDAIGIKATNYKRWKGLKYSGYVRSYTQFRDMPVRYGNNQAANSQYDITQNGLGINNGINYTGYQEPLMLLRIEGSPTARTFFKLEYMLDNQMVGQIRQDTVAANQNGIGGNLNRRSMIYRIFQFTGGINTKIGDFTLIAGGGVNWYRLSPFTLWNYEYRDDMFERYPWDPEQTAWNKYNVYYASQNIARDARWGNTGTQGFILNGKNLPFGLGFDLLYGKTDNSGGYQTYLAKTPKNMMAGRLKKSIKTHEFGGNWMSQFGSSDGIGFNKIRQDIITTDARLNFTKFKIFYEVGVGRFQDGVVDESTRIFLNGNSNTRADGTKIVGDSISSTIGRDFGWGKNFTDMFNNNRAFQFQFDFKKEWFNFPLMVQAFSIGKSVVNVNSQVLNSANNHAIGIPANVGTVYDITTLTGAITDIGQMTNNRQGINIKHENTYGKLKVSFGIAASQEIQNDTVNSKNQISYWHQVNAFTRSRFTYFENSTGPYGRITSIFRRTYEQYTITDAVVNYKKSYNTMNLSLKYKFTLFNKEIILSNYNLYNSVTDHFSPIATFSNAAFLRTFYEEAMIFVNIHPKVTLLGFYGIEKVWGNQRMNLADANGNEIVNASGKQIYDPNGLTIDQTGHGYGFGIDYDFAGRAGLYLRQRFFDNKDVHFTKDTFSGYESTVELKIFF